MVSGTARPRADPRRDRSHRPAVYAGLVSSMPGPAAGKRSSGRSKTAIAEGLEAEGLEAEGLEVEPRLMATH